MPMWVKDGGTWQNAIPDVKDGGAWGALKILYAKAAGVWSIVWPGVKLSGASVAQLVFSGTATAGIRVNSDGTIDQNVGGSYSQISASTDWIIPNSDANSLYEVRVTNVVGDAFTTSPGTDGNWFTLGTDREWNLQQGPAVGSKAVAFDLEIRYNGGTTLASTAYDLDVERA